jgi:hypothetical protein
MPQLIREMRNVARYRVNIEMEIAAEDENRPLRYRRGGGLSEEALASMLADDWNQCFVGWLD